MFTMADIRNIAVQIEKNGEDTYRKAGHACSNPEVAQVLLAMAADEKRHGEWLANLTSNKPLTEAQKEMESVGKSLLQDMVKGNPFLLAASELERAASVREVVIRSKAFEEDTILFYQFIREFLDDLEAVQQLQLIIAEEHKHLHQLELLETMQQGEPRKTVSA
jgi:rubrerythrin